MQVSTPTPVPPRAPGMAPIRAGKRRGLQRRYIALLLIASVVTIYGAATYPRYRSEMTTARNHLLAGSKLVDTDAGIIEFAEQGDGPPVLSLHGAGGGYDQGLLLQAFFPDGHRIIAPSRFGYARSPILGDGSAIAQADAYADLLDVLGIHQVVVTGFSDGGPSALQFALRHPERTSALLMISAKSHTPPPDSIIQSAAFNTIFRSEYVYWTLTENFERGLLAVLGMPEEVQERLSSHEMRILADFTRSMHPMKQRRAGIYHDRKVATNHMPPDVYPLELISAPTLVIHGELDSLQPFSHAQHTADSIPGAELMAIGPGGHMLVEHLNEISNKIAAFLQ